MTILAMVATCFVGCLFDGPYTTDMMDIPKFLFIKGLAGIFLITMVRLYNRWKAYDIFISAYARHCERQYNRMNRQHKVF